VAWIALTVRNLYIPPRVNLKEKEVLVSRILAIAGASPSREELSLAAVAF